MEVQDSERIRSQFDQEADITPEFREKVIKNQSSTLLIENLDA